MRPARLSPVVPLALLAAALVARPSTAQAADLFSTALQRYGLVAALGSAFIVGLMTAATPCVYPMIAITVSVFGARRETRARAMWLSTAFVLGLAALFVPLGLFAGLTGTVAGRLAGSPWVQGFEAVLMLGMALNMFGLFEISLPSSVQDRLSLVGGLGARGAFLVGFATGPIAAPCATAGLVGILDYVFQQRDVAGGGLALFSYSLGLGLPFWLVGSLSLGLPKPGLWMDRVKSVFGVVLVVLGLYYLRHIVPAIASPPRGLPTSSWFFLALLVAGVALGAVHLSLKEGSIDQRLRKVVGIALAAVGGLWLAAYEPPAPTIAWVAPSADLGAVARQRHQPVLVDFGATWCAACEELLRHTFSDETVRREAARFVTVRVDATESTPSIDALQARYRVRGLPTVLLFDSSGREVTRVSEFIPAPRMLQLMRGVN